MRTKCDACLCRTCLESCCDRKSCAVNKDSCEGYRGFKQLSIFERTEPRGYRTPRYSFKHYGLSDERVKELEKLIRSGEEKYIPIASQAAYKANKIIYGHILLSVQRNLSYEGLEKLWARGEIERIPYGKTDFYGIRRYFYHLFDLEVRRIGK